MSHLFGTQEYNFELRLEEFSKMQKLSAIWPKAVYKY